MIHHMIPICSTQAWKWEKQNVNLARIDQGAPSCPRGTKQFSRSKRNLPCLLPLLLDVRGVNIILLLGSTSKYFTCCKHDPTTRLLMSWYHMIPICSTQAWKITETTWEPGPSKPPILWINGQPQGFCAWSHVKRAKDWRIRKSDSNCNTSPATSRGSSRKGKNMKKQPQELVWPLIPPSLRHSSSWLRSRDLLQRVGGIGRCNRHANLTVAMLETLKIHQLEDGRIYSIWTDQEHLRMESFRGRTTKRQNKKVTQPRGFRRLVRRIPEQSAALEPKHGAKSCPLLLASCHKSAWRQPEEQQEFRQWQFQAIPLQVACTSGNALAN